MKVLLIKDHNASDEQSTRGDTKTSIAEKIRRVAMIQRRTRAKLEFMIIVGM